MRINIFVILCVYLLSGAVHAEDFTCPRQQVKPLTSQSSVTMASGKQVIRQLTNYNDGSLGLVERSLCYRDETYFRIEYSDQDPAVAETIATKLRTLISESHLANDWKKAGFNYESAIIKPLQKALREGQPTRISLNDSLKWDNTSGDVIEGQLLLADLPPYLSSNKVVALYIDIGPDISHMDGDAF